MCLLYPSGSGVPWRVCVPLLGLFNDRLPSLYEGGGGEIDTRERRERRKSKGSERQGEVRRRGGHKRDCLGLTDFKREKMNGTGKWSKEKHLSQLMTFLCSPPSASFVFVYTVVRED